MKPSGPHTEMRGIALPVVIAEFNTELNLSSIVAMIT